MTTASDSRSTDDPTCAPAAPESKLWGGRFAEATDAMVERLNASVHFDQRLAVYDILGSLAHSAMLAQQGILTGEERSSIAEGLISILADVQAGRFTWRVDREDVHMNVEAALAERIGPVAGKLHTARSRNDQVALDLRLWLRATILDQLDALAELLAALHTLADAGLDVPMPGYTHLQRAQPVLAAHHFLAYAEMFERDAGRLEDAWVRVDVMPLGSGALAGTPHPIDRARVAELLRFSALSRNSLDAVADRDFALEFLSAAAICQIHLSRLSEELVLWTSQEFGFVEIGDAFCTGSSIMPQKKNPDIAELVRGKAGRVIGDLTSLLVTMKGLPLAYNKDMQEDKEPVFDAADTLLACVTVTARMLSRTRLRADRMGRALREGYLTATDLADALVERGMPFREAHRVVGELVGLCASRGLELTELPADELSARAGVPAEELMPYLDVRRSLERRDVPGGPAPRQVVEALSAARSRHQRLVERNQARRGSVDLSHLLSSAPPARGA